MGITNTVVTSAAPDQLSRRFVACFDRIMLDAPCSGEGMFRKDAAAIAEWSPEHVDLCVARQWDIVQEAYRMLKPGGTLAYSTCTFNTAENEEMIERILLQYPDLQLQEMKRLWPHLERGEGILLPSWSKRRRIRLSATIKRPLPTPVRLRPNQTGAANRLLRFPPWPTFKTGRSRTSPALSLAAARRYCLAKNYIGCRSARACLGTTNS